MVESRSTDRPLASRTRLHFTGSASSRPHPAQAASTARPHLNDHGTFDIFAAGKSIGTEQFEIRARSNQIQAQANVQLRVEQDGKTVEIRTSSNLLLDPLLEPLSYAWDQKAEKVSQLSIDFRARPAHARYKTVNGQDDQRDFQLPKDVVVLDDNALHQYQLALARYDLQKNGAQIFHAFIPQEALPGVITLSLVGPESVTLEGDQRTLRRFLLTADQAQISLWVDEEGRLQMVSVPAAQYQAVRRKR